MDSKSLIKLKKTSPLSEWRERINDLIDFKINENITYVPVNHASVQQMYGTGGNDVYGHVALSNATDSTSDVTEGVAATPKAVKTAYDLAKNAIPKSSTSIGSASSPVTFTGTFKGNADTATSATSATQATKDGDGNIISETYVKGTDLTSYLSEIAFVKVGTSINWRDILTDYDDDYKKINSFIYQKGCNGYMPALNLDTEEGRVGFGTYYNNNTLKGVCRWDYFLKTNESNTPDSFIDLKRDSVVISTPTITAVTSKLETNEITNSTDISTNNINVKNNLNICGTIFNVKYNTETKNYESDDTGSLGLCSGTTWNTSPSMSLYGKGYKDTTLAGAFQLRAIGTTNSYKLTCKSSDGSMVWEGTSFIVNGSVKTNEIISNITKVQTPQTILSTIDPLKTSYPVITAWQGYKTKPNSGGGINVALGGSGLTVIGSGEGLDSYISENKTSQTDELVLISDKSITFYVNANTYDDKKVGLELKTNGDAVINNHLCFANGTELWIE